MNGAGGVIAIVSMPVLKRARVASIAKKIRAKHAPRDYISLMMILRRNDILKTLWINELTGTNYDDYDEAVESVLENARYIESDIIREVFEEYNPNEILHAMIDLERGTHLYEKITEEVNNRILSNYLIESEVPDEEYDFIMED